MSPNDQHQDAARWKLTTMPAYLLDQSDPRPELCRVFGYGRFYMVLLRILFGSVGGFSCSNCAGMVAFPLWNRIPLPFISAGASLTTPRQRSMPSAFAIVPWHRGFLQRAQVSWGLAFLCR